MLQIYLGLLGGGVLLLVVIQLVTRVKRPSYGKKKQDKSPHLQDSFAKVEKKELQKDPSEKQQKKPKSFLEKIREKALEKKSTIGDDSLNLRKMPEASTQKFDEAKPLAEQANSVDKIVDVADKSAKNKESSDEWKVKHDKVESMLAEKNTKIEALAQQLQQEKRHRESFEEIRNSLQEELDGLRKELHILRKNDSEAPAQEGIKEVDDVHADEKIIPLPKEDILKSNLASDAFVSGDDLTLMADDEDDVIPATVKPIESVEPEPDYSVDDPARNDTLNDDSNDLKVTLSPIGTSPKIFNDPVSDEDVDEEETDDSEDAAPALHDVFSEEPPVIDPAKSSSTTKDLESELLSDIERDLNKE